MKTTNYAHDPILALEHGTWEHWDHQESWKNLLTRWEDIAGVSLDSVRYDGRTLAKQLLRMDISFTSVAKRTDMKMGLVFLFSRTPWTQSWCQPISSRLITIRLRATPFNITIVQAYAPTTDYDDEKIEGFYEQLQEVVDQIPKKDILVVQGDWNAKVGKDACKNWKYTCGLYSNNETNERGLRLLEFASLNDLKLANTFGPHKASRRWTWHSPNGKHHNQIDYIMIKRRFQTSVNIAKTRSFPGADIGSDHDLVMMTFKLHLKKVSKQGHSRIRFDLEKLKDPEVAEMFKARIGGKFAPLTLLDTDDVDMDDLINKFNVAVTETANETLGKYRHHKQPWVTSKILHLCNKRRELKKDKFTTEGAKQYKAVNQQIKKGMVKARETWIEERCQEIDDSLGKNNNKKAYQLVKDLTSSKQGRTTTIQDKNGSASQKTGIFSTDGQNTVRNCTITKWKGTQKYWNTHQWPT